MTSVLTKDQKKTYTKYFVEDGQEYEITVTARYDDKCNNGHNTFALTAEIWATKNKRRTRRDCESCGCLHEDIAKHFPELAPFIKWHLVSSDIPMHYATNTLYHFSDKDHNGLRKGEKKQLREGGKREIEFAKSSCVWGAAPDDSHYKFEQMSEKELEDYLKIRLPHVQMAFQKAMETLGFTY